MRLRDAVAIVGHNHVEGPGMVGVALTAEEIRAAPPEVRRWIEQQVIRAGGRLPPEHAAPGHSSAGAPDRGTGDDRTGRGTIEMSEKDQVARDAALRRLIAERAYELWENQGKPHGCELIHWRQAERQIMDCVEVGAGPSQGARLAAMRPGAAGQD
jgi:Protein of unknown function (DUF2934)